MGSKVTFDPITKIIQIDEAPVDGVVEIDVKIDLYSDGKEDWVSTPSLTMISFPIRNVGGDPLPGDKALGATFFLDNAWKIRPYEGDHRLLVNGNLYSEDGTSPFTQVVGSYNVMVEIIVSSLVDSILRQLPEIQFASFQNGVWISPTHPNAQDGTAFPIGTREYPSKNFNDTITIANNNGFNTLYLMESVACDGHDLSGLILIGENHLLTTLTLTNSCITLGTEFSEMTITGEFNGECLLNNCKLDGPTGFKGTATNCILNTSLGLGGSFGDVALFLDCWLGSSVVGGVTTIDMNGDGPTLNMRGHSGAVKIINKTGDSKVAIDFLSGRIIVDSTVEAGTFYLRDGAEISEDLSTGTTIHSILSVETIKQNKESNKKYEYVEATEENATRKVAVGVLDHMIIKIKDDHDSDWSSPISTDTLYMWYDVKGDSNPIMVGESD